MDNERNDYAALNYFFIQRLDPPRLCSIDLPEGHLDASFPEFDDHYLPRDKAAILVRYFTCCHNRERIQRQISILEVWRPVRGCRLRDTSAHHLLTHLFGDLSTEKAVKHCSWMWTGPVPSIAGNGITCCTS